jgi:hypothetical protein
VKQLEQRIVQLKIEKEKLVQEVEEVLSINTKSRFVFFFSQTIHILTRDYLGRRIFDKHITKEIR